jgi:hypothetical protein
LYWAQRAFASLREASVGSPMVTEMTSWRAQTAAGLAQV